MKLISLSLTGFEEYLIYFKKTYVDEGPRSLRQIFVNSLKGIVYNYIDVVIQIPLLIGFGD